MIKIDSAKHKEIENQLLYQTSLLEAQMEATPDGILIVDENGKIIMYNQRFVKMWKIPNHVIVTGNDKEALDFVVSQVADQDGFIKRVSYLYKYPQVASDEILFKDGRIFHRYSAPVKGKNDEYYGYAWYFRDITEQKKLERQKDEFLAIASHELKTPITSIKIYSQFLLTSFQKKGDEKATGQLTKMYAQVNKLTNLISDLLDVTKIKGGKLQLNKEEFDFNTLVDDIIADLQLTTEKHSIVKEFSKTKTVYADRDRLGQVITNFLSNAIKYSPDSNKIIVQIKNEKNDVLFSVQDFGIGISKDEQRNVFKRFVRVSEHHKTFPGLGLGLYISKEIMKRHGGKIWMKSEKGKGSTFYFSLPLDHE